MDLIWFDFFLLNSYVWLTEPIIVPGGDSTIISWLHAEQHENQEQNPAQHL